MLMVVIVGVVPGVVMVDALCYSSLSVGRVDFGLFTGVSGFS